MGTEIFDFEKYTSVVDEKIKEINANNDQIYKAFPILKQLKLLLVSKLVESKYDLNAFAANNGGLSYDESRKRILNIVKRMQEKLTENFGTIEQLKSNLQTLKMHNKQADNNAYSLLIKNKLASQLANVRSTEVNAKLDEIIQAISKSDMNDYVKELIRREASIMKKELYTQQRIRDVEQQQRTNARLLNEITFKLLDIRNDTEITQKTSYDTIKKLNDNDIRKVLRYQVNIEQSSLDTDRIITDYMIKNIYSNDNSNIEADSLWIMQQITLANDYFLNVKNSFAENENALVEELKQLKTDLYTLNTKSPDSPDVDTKNDEVERVELEYTHLKSTNIKALNELRKNIDTFVDSLKKLQFLNSKLLLINNSQMKISQIHHLPDNIGETLNKILNEYNFIINYHNIVRVKVRFFNGRANNYNIATVYNTVSAQQVKSVIDALYENRTDKDREYLKKFEDEDIINKYPEELFSKYREYLSKLNKFIREQNDLVLYLKSPELADIKVAELKQLVDKKTKNVVITLENYIFNPFLTNRLNDRLNNYFDAETTFLSEKPHLLIIPDIDNINTINIHPETIEKAITHLDILLETELNTKVANIKRSNIDDLISIYFRYMANLLIKPNILRVMSFTENELVKFLVNTVLLYPVNFVKISNAENQLKESSQVIQLQQDNYYQIMLKFMFIDVTELYYNLISNPAFSKFVKNMKSLIGVDIKDKIEEDTEKYARIIQSLNAHISSLNIKTYFSNYKPKDPPIMVGPVLPTNTIPEDEELNTTDESYTNIYMNNDRLQEDMSDEYKKTHQKILALDNEIDKLKKQLAEAQLYDTATGRVVTTLQTTDVSQIKQVEELKRLNERIMELTTQLDAQKAAYEKLLQEKQTNDTTIKDNEAIMATLTSEKEAQQKELDVLKANKAPQDQITALQSEMARKDELITNNKQLLDDAKNKNVELTKQIEVFKALEGQLAEKQGQINDINKEKADLQQELNELKEQLAIQLKNTDTEKLKKQIEELEEKKKNAEDTLREQINIEKDNKFKSAAIDLIAHYISNYYDSMFAGTLRNITSKINGAANPLYKELNPYNSNIKDDTIKQVSNKDVDTLRHKLQVMDLSVIKEKLIRVILIMHYYFNKITDSSTIKQNENRINDSFETIKAIIIDTTNINNVEKIYEEIDKKLFVQSGGHQQLIHTYVEQIPYIQELPKDFKFLNIMTFLDIVKAVSTDPKGDDFNNFCKIWIGVYILNTLLIRQPEAFIKFSIVFERKTASHLEKLNNIVLEKHKQFPILTYLKVRLDTINTDQGADNSMTYYNKRFKIETDGKSVHVAYNDHNFPYYLRKNGNDTTSEELFNNVNNNKEIDTYINYEDFMDSEWGPVKKVKDNKFAPNIHEQEGGNSEKQLAPYYKYTDFFDIKNNSNSIYNFDVKKYMYDYMFGPFTKVFPPGFKENKEVAPHLTEILTNLSNGKNVFVLGYGASGAGKTSSLIYFKLDKPDGTRIRQDGIIIELCNYLGQYYEVTDINLSAFEFYEPSDSVAKKTSKPFTRQTVISKAFQYNQKTKKFTLKENYNHKNKFYHTPAYKLKGLAQDSINSLKVMNDIILNKTTSTFKEYDELSASQLKEKVDTIENNFKKSTDLKYDIDTNEPYQQVNVVEYVNIINTIVVLGKIFSALYNSKKTSPVNYEDIISPIINDSKNDTIKKTFISFTETDIITSIRNILKNFETVDFEEQIDKNGTKVDKEFVSKLKKTLFKENQTTVGEVCQHIIDLDRYAKATTNNPNSSRSHAIIILKLKSVNFKSTLLIGDFAGVENKFQCENSDVLKNFMNIKPTDDKTVFFYQKYGATEEDRPANPEDYVITDSTARSEITKRKEIIANELETALDNSTFTFRAYNPDKYNFYTFKLNQIDDIKQKQPLDDTTKGKKFASLGDNWRFFSDKDKDIIVKVDTFYKKQKAILASYKRSDIFRRCEDNNEEVYLFKKNTFEKKFNNPELDEFFGKNANLYSVLERMILTLHGIKIDDIINNIKTDVESGKDIKLTQIKLLEECFIKTNLEIPFKTNEFLFSDKTTEIEYLADVLASVFTITKNARTKQNSEIITELMTTFINKAEKSIDNRFSLPDSLHEVPQVGETDTAKLDNNIQRFKDSLDNRKENAEFKNNGLKSQVYTARYDKWETSKTYITYDIIFNQFKTYITDKDSTDVAKKNIAIESLLELNELPSDSFSGLLYICDKIKKLDLLLFPDNASIDMSSYSGIYNVLNTIDKRLYDLLANYICKYPIAYRVCQVRTQEGLFINKSLADIRDNIKDLLETKTKNTLRAVPNFVDICLKDYCDNDECFTQRTKPKKNVNSIATVIEKFVCPFTELVMAVFCVMNISLNASNPPPTAYLDINNLKDYYYKFYNSCVTENYKTNQVTSQAYRIFRMEAEYLINKIDNHFANIGSAIELRKTQEYTNFYNKLKILDVDLSFNKNSISKLTGELLQFCEQIDKVNAASTIGTLEFVDGLSKYYSVNRICNVSSNSTSGELNMDKSSDIQEMFDITNTDLLAQPIYTVEPVKKQIYTPLERFQRGIAKLMRILKAMNDYKQKMINVFKSTMEGGAIDIAEQIDESYVAQPVQKTDIQLVNITSEIESLIQEVDSKLEELEEHNLYIEDHISIKEDRDIVYAHAKEIYDIVSDNITTINNNINDILIKEKGINEIPPTTKEIVQNELRSIVNIAKSFNAEELPGEITELFNEIGTVAQAERTKQNTQERIERELLEKQMADKLALEAEQKLKEQEAEKEKVLKDAQNDIVQAADVEAKKLFAQQNPDIVPAQKPAEIPENIIDSEKIKNEEIARLAHEKLIELENEQQKKLKIKELEEKLRADEERKLKEKEEEAERNRLNMEAAQEIIKIKKEQELERMKEEEKKALIKDSKEYISFTWKWLVFKVLYTMNMNVKLLTVNNTTVSIDELINRKIWLYQELDINASDIKIKALLGINIEPRFTELYKYTLDKLNTITTIDNVSALEKQFRTKSNVNMFITSQWIRDTYLNDLSELLNNLLDGNIQRLNGQKIKSILSKYDVNVNEINLDKISEYANTPQEQRWIRLAKEINDVNNGIIKLKDKIKKVLRMSRYAINENGLDTLDWDAKIKSLDLLVEILFDALYWQNKCYTTSITYTSPEEKSDETVNVENEEDYLKKQKTTFDTNNDLLVEKVAEILNPQSTGQVKTI